MTNLKIGNWLVTENGIQWDGKPNVDYTITKARLLELGGGNRSTMYDWLVHIPAKSWTTEADIYALNTAFIYALASFDLSLNNQFLIDTLTEQQIVIKNK